MADSNMRGFSRGLSTASSHRRQMLSFQPGSVGMAAAGGGRGPSQIQIGGAGAGGSGYGFVGGGGLSALVQTGPSNNVQIEPVVGDVNREQGLTSDWSIEEQCVLNRGMIKHAASKGMMKYIKIASMLPRKTVRDVALRCQFLAKFDKAKRQKLEEQHAGKKRKGKMVESCSEANTNMVTSGNISSDPPCNQNTQFPSEDDLFYGANQQLMHQNNLIFAQIQDNIITMKVQENIDLFNRVKDNIRTISYNMSQMPGKMSQMPQLPVSLEEDLLTAVTYLQNPLLGVHGTTYSEGQPMQQSR